MNEKDSPPAGGLIPAISLWRPWADWVVLGWKTIETRTHTRFHRLGEKPTWVAIHASQRWDKSALEAAGPWLTAYQKEWTAGVIRSRDVGGSVIGLVKVVAFGPLDAGHEKASLIECASTQRYGLHLEDATPLPPFPVRGQRGLFRVRLPYRRQGIPDAHELSGSANRMPGVVALKVREGPLWVLAMNSFNS